MIIAPTITNGSIIATPSAIFPVSNKGLAEMVMIAKPVDST
jgi:hypothetical protein